MKHRIETQIIGVSGHSRHLVKYKTKWWYRWRRYDNVFRWREDAEKFIKFLEDDNSK